MLRLLLALCPLVAACSAVAQGTFLVSTGANICRAGYDVPVAATAYNCPPEQLALITTNGTIRRNGKGHFIFRPARVNNETVLRAYRIRGTDSLLLGSRLFRVGYHSPATLLTCGRPPVSPWEGTSVIREELAAKTRLEALDGAYLDPRLRITGFDCEIRTGTDSTRNVLHSNDSRFSPAMAAAFRKLRKGDKVSFTNIRCLGNDSIARTLTDIFYLVREPEARAWNDVPIRTSQPPADQSGDLVIALSNEKTCYVGFDQALFAATIGCRNTNLQLVTDNGRIYRDKPGVFRFVPARSDTIAVITGYTVKGHDSIFRGRQMLWIEPIPASRTSCFSGGNMEVFPQDMANMKSVARLFDFTDQLDEPTRSMMTIVGFSYSVKFAATGLITDELPAYSDGFSPAMIAINKKLAPGDRVFIDYIQAKGPDGKIRNLGTLTVIIW